MTTPHLPISNLRGLTEAAYAHAYQRGWTARARGRAYLDDNPYPNGGCVTTDPLANAWEDGYLDRNREDDSHKWVTPLLGYEVASGDFTEEEYQEARAAARRIC